VAEAACTGLPSGGAGFELIPINAHCGLCVGASHDNAFDNQREPHAIVQKYRPVDGGFEELPGREGFGSGEEQTPAADIYAFARNDATLDPAAFNGQTQ
jgi:hypothetical protein